MFPAYVRMALFVVVYAIFMVSQGAFVWSLYLKWEARTTTKASWGKGGSPYTTPDVDVEEVNSKYPDGVTPDEKKVIEQHSGEVTPRPSMFTRYWNKLSQIYAQSMHEMSQGGQKRYAGSKSRSIAALAAAASGSGAAAGSASSMMGVSQISNTKTRSAANARMAPTGAGSGNGVSEGVRKTRERMAEMLMRAEVAADGEPTEAEAHTVIEG